MVVFERSAVELFEFVLLECPLSFGRERKRTERKRPASCVVPRALSLRRELRSSPAAHLSSLSACAPLRVLSAEPVRLKPALLRMPEGQNRWAECLILLKFECLLGRKF